MKERSGIRGVPLTSGGRITDFEILGYADDTAVYLRDRLAVLSVFQVCRRIERSLSSLNSTLADHPCLWAHAVSIYILQQVPADILAYLCANMVRYLPTGRIAYDHYGVDLY